MNISIDQTIRFKDSGETIYSFGKLFYVVCPTCSSLAISKPIHSGSSIFENRRLICVNCGLLKDWHGNQITVGPHHDWHFDLPLWLSTECCGEILSAYNPDHLEYMESFVLAKIREREKNKFGWTNKSYFSRLPSWIKDAKNRETILKAIKKIRKERPV